jgi:hypothetical protein
MKIVKTLKKSPVQKPAKASGPVAHVAYTVAQVKGLFKIGLDGAGAWLGKQIKDKLVTSLITNKDKVLSTRVARTDRVLFVSGRQAYAWPLTGHTGDIYERADGKGTVRGLVSALKDNYGDKNVRLVSKPEAIKLLKAHKSEPASLRALGVA